MKLCLIATLVLLTACSADAWWGGWGGWGGYGGYGLGGYYGGYYPYYWGKRDTSEVATELKRDWTKKSEMVPVKRSVEESMLVKKTLPITRSEIMWGEVLPENTERSTCKFHK
jgi:hypothetical protein